MVSKRRLKIEELYANDVLQLKAGHGQVDN